MEAIQTALYEDPLAIYISLGCIGTIGLIYFGFQRTFRSARPLIFTIFAAAAVFAISTLVVTEREKIVAVCDQIAAAINEDRPGDIDPFIAEDFIGPGRTTPLARRPDTGYIAQQIKIYQVTSVKYRILKLDLREGAADMRVFTNVVGGRLPITRMIWDVTWLKRSDRWLIQKIDYHVGQHSGQDR
jgi:hypothetical protein